MAKQMVEGRADSSPVKPTEIEKIKRYIEDRKSGEFLSAICYQIDFFEAVALANMCAENAIEAVALAFSYGRAKGYRAAKARAKRGQTD